MCVEPNFTFFECRRDCGYSSVQRTDNIEFIRCPVCLVTMRWRCCRSDDVVEGRDARVDQRGSICDGSQA
jgi:hypothetical protein